MSDISDLHGVYPTPVRWNAETGVLGLSIYDGASGEPRIEEIELSGPRSRFAMDMATRERGYGLIRPGVYDMRLSPVGTVPPEWPGGEYKAAIGVWLWNPILGEVRLETNQSTLCRAISAVWDNWRKYKEASAGQVPIIEFADRYEQHYSTIGKTFIGPKIIILGSVPRDKVPPFAVREMTVKPPPALDTQIAFGILPDHSKPPQPAQKEGQIKAAAKKPKPRRNLSDSLDDEIPEDL